MATNVNWFVIWVPSSSTERRKRRDTAEKLKKNEDVMRKNSSSDLTRVTSVVSGRFEIKKDIDSHDNKDSSPSRKTSSVSEPNPVLRDETSSDLTSELKKNEDVVRKDSSSDLNRVTSVVSGRFEIKKDIDSHDNKDSPSRKTSLVSNNTVVVDEAEKTMKNGIANNGSEINRSTQSFSFDVSNRESEIEENGTESEEEDGEKTIHDAFLELETMEDIVNRVIKDKDIASLHIVSSHDSKQTQFSFCVTLDRVEDILLELQSNGIGQAEQCTIRSDKHLLKYPEH